MNKAQKAKIKISREEKWGDQPWLILNKKGDVTKINMNAVCIAYTEGHGFDKEDKEVFIQIPVATDRNKPSPDKKQPVGDKKLVDAWVRYLRSRKDFRPFLPAHSVEDRWEYGIPIPLNGLPENGLLLLSTYLRYFWDRHNSSYSSRVKYIYENFNVSLETAFIIGNLVSWAPNDDFPSEDVTLRSWDGCHCVFGKSISYEMFVKFVKHTLPMKPHYTKKENKISRNHGLGISSYFRQGDTNLMDQLYKDLHGEVGIFKNKGWGYESYLIEGQNFNKFVGVMTKYIKEIKNA